MKRCFLIVLIFVVLLSQVNFPALSAEIPELDGAKAYVLMEASTKAVIDGKNADIRLNAGYLSKLMTVLIISDDIDEGKLSLTDELTASSNVTGTKGAVVWLENGDKMTVDELLKAVIVGNANDAVTVLAENSAGSVGEFVMRMNSRAFDLGLRDTVFRSPYGYYDEGEFTTAADLAVICSELSARDLMRPYFAIWRDFVRSGQTELVNEDTLARTYDRHIGFKACHSEEGGYCIAEAGEDEGGNCYISVILGCPDSDSSFSAAKKLLRRGFGDFKVTATMFPDEMLMPLKVRGGCDTAVEICLKEQSRLVVPKNVSELGTAVVIPEYLTAPVKKGQVVGTAAFYSEKNLVCEVDIITKDAVEELSFAYILKKTLYDLLK